MRIVHVVDSLEVGGAEMLVCEMCRMQRQRGDEPSVYALSRLGALGERMWQEQFEVRYDLGHKLTDGVRNLYRAFHQARPDVIHFHNPTPTIYGAGSAKAAGVRVVISTRHSLVAKPRHAEEIKYAIASLFCDRVVGICDATVANLKALHSILPGKLARVYNGVLPMARISAENCPPKEGFTLLFVGRLEPVKNLTLLLEAFSKAHLRNRNLRLWVVGEGSERPKLEALTRSLGITAVVKFWGQQLNVAPFYSAADLFTMSSTSEGLPLSLLQSFSIGLPVVVTDVGGMSEVVRFADAGMTVPANSPDGLATAIFKLSQNESEQHRLGANAATAYQKYFSLEKTVEAYMRIYSPTTRNP